MKILSIFIPALIVSSAVAQPSPDELAKLRESYTRAIERATSPITATYVTELKKLIEKHTKAGNLDAALAARTELESVNKEATSPATRGSPSSTPTPVVATPSADTTPAASKGKISTSDKKRIESYLVGKTWATVIPDSSKVVEYHYFARNGTGARMVGDVVTTALKWSIKDDGTVYVTLAGFPKHITFISAEKATMIAHADPPKGDVTQEIKLSSETIPGVK